MFLNKINKSKIISLGLILLRIKYLSTKSNLSSILGGKIKHKTEERRLKTKVREGV
jgi:hypothetical protein